MKRAKGEAGTHAVMHSLACMRLNPRMSCQGTASAAPSPEENIRHLPLGAARG
jgi:hypothetical protein